MFKIKHLYKRARALGKTLVYPEAAFSDRTIEAARYVAKKKIAKVILIGDESALILRNKKLAQFHIINPKTSDKTKELAALLYSKRKEKGMTEEEAERLVLDPYYFATLLVEAGYADGMVAGAETSTANTIRPALQIIKGARSASLISSAMLLYGKNDALKRPLIIADCAINIAPTADQLCEIASHSVKTAQMLGLQNPKVAFLSYSTKGSAKGESVDTVREACAKFKKQYELCDGEMQLDSAICPEVAQQKCKESLIKGDADILICPDLNSGNILYKAVQRLGGLQAIGPILQGVKKPVNDLSRGASAEEIIAVSAVTALQCKEEK